jgi:SAM-dependent methyltransferase
MTEINVFPEYSTQPKAQLPNPALIKAIRYMKEELNLGLTSRIADQGCGALRHLGILAASFSCILLVETQKQLLIKRNFDGHKSTLRDYVTSLKIPNIQLTLLNSNEFELSSLQLDTIFNICTFDVVLPESRIQMLKSAYRNLKNGGYLLIIIPRNDTSILYRCKEDNKFLDGYIFKRDNCDYYTFYTNYRHSEDIIKLASNFGFSIYKDLSTFKQICMIYKKNRVFNDP